MANTIGMTAVARFSVATAPPYVTITSTFCGRISAASSTTRSERPCVQVIQGMTERASMKPSSKRLCPKAEVRSLHVSSRQDRWLAVASLCARQHAADRTAAPPMRTINSRRLMRIVPRPRTTLYHVANSAASQPNGQLMSVLGHFRPTTVQWPRLVTQGPLRLHSLPGSMRSQNLFGRKGPSDDATRDGQAGRPTGRLHGNDGCARFRHLPVLDAGKVVGVISIGDVVKDIIRNLEHNVGDLMGYIDDGRPRGLTDEPRCCRRRPGGKTEGHRIDDSQTQCITISVLA